MKYASGKEQTHYNTVHVGQLMNESKVLSDGVGPFGKSGMHSKSTP